MGRPGQRTRSVSPLFSEEDADLRPIPWNRHGNKAITYDNKAINSFGGQTVAHRVVMTRMIGRPLTAGDKVLPIDGSSLNCQRDNLYIKGQQ